MSEKVCPTCGRCPTCGHGPVKVTPWNPWVPPYPYPSYPVYPNTNPFWYSNVTNDGTSININSI